MSDKIKPHHLQRKAVLYIRQSSAYQVAHNQESRRLQYAMKGRLQRLGWTEIDIVDEDLGRSAAGTVTRCGFERFQPRPSHSNEPNTYFRWTCSRPAGEPIPIHRGQTQRYRHLWRKKFPKRLKNWTHSTSFPPRRWMWTKWLFPI